MHILFLSDNFPPEVNAPASRTFEHCREWARSGHRVTVITTAPNFPKGNIFDGYRNRLWQREELHGVRVIRVWTYITANKGLVKRSLDYLSFMITGFMAALFVPKVDIVVGTSPQFFTVCAAYMVGLFKRVPFVFELRDFWPESIKVVGAMKPDSLPIRAFERVERFLYRKATAIVAVTESYKRILVERGVEPAKIEVVTNGVDLQRYRPCPKDPDLVRRYGLQGKFVAGYVGTHGMAHALETVLEAAACVNQHPGGKNIHFLFLGDGARKAALVSRAERMGLQNVTFLDSVHKRSVVKYWSLLDVSIVHLKKKPLFTTVIPSKLFESMGMGIPILHGVEGESADIVRKEGVGIPFEPENAEALCDGVIKLKEDPGLHDRMKAQCLIAARRYERSDRAQSMLGILKRLCEPREVFVSSKERRGL